MSILGILLSLAVFGLIVWLIVTFIPMPEAVRNVIIAVAVICLILWILGNIGLLAPINRPILIR